MRLKGLHLSFWRGRESSEAQGQRRENQQRQQRRGTETSENDDGPRSLNLTTVLAGTQRNRQKPESRHEYSPNSWRLVGSFAW